MKKQEHKNNKKEKGVALLFVILLTSVLLMVTIGISNITFKELVFSLEARDSDKAFFAADTGIECALYLDKSATFVTSPPANTCNGLPVLVNETSADEYQFALPLADVCANVIVKTALDPYATGELYTSIQSFGYNTSVDSTTGECPDSTVSSRVVSRGLSVAFPNGGTGSGTATLVPPTVTTLSGGGSNPLFGRVDSPGTGSIFTHGVDYGLTPSYGGTQSSGGVSTGVAWAFPLPGAICGLTYHYRAFATNSSGLRGDGADMTYIPVLPYCTP